MSERSTIPGAVNLADTFALAVQKLYGADKLDSAQPLIRIDPRAEAKNAPFQFDSAESVIHRRNCRAIPVGSRSALYAVWQVDGKDWELACKKCRPMPHKNKLDRPADVGDILLGLVSLVDQFSSILSQRGQDFRRTERGRHVEQSLSGFFGELSRVQQEGVNLLTGAVDRLYSAIDQYNHTNNGHNGGGVAKRRNGTAKKKASSRRKPSKSSPSIST